MRWGTPFALGESVTAINPVTQAQCRADERRIRPIVEPAANELVSVDARYLTNSKRPIQLLRAAYDAYLKLKAAAEADGISADRLTIVSGYRSVEHQRRLWQGALQRYGSPQAARKWVAPPGGSPHHTGRAIDFWLGTSNSSKNIAALRATPGFHWLVCNAARFDFFPYAAEPWHWEYNPNAGDQPVARSRPRQRPAQMHGFGWYGGPVPAPRPMRKPQEINPRGLTICGGKPFTVIDEFHFDKDTLRRDAVQDHFKQIEAVAVEIVRRWTMALGVPSVCIEGHTDFIGSETYNLGLGERRARRVKDELCKALTHHALAAGAPWILSKMTFVVNTLGEIPPDPPGGADAQRKHNRRVKVYLLKEPVPGERCPFPERTPTCLKVDVLTESICENARRICKIAAELGDQQSLAKCKEVLKTCEEARERSKRC